MRDIPVATAFFHAFWPALAAGLVVLAVGYIAINWLLGLRERARSEERIRGAILRIVLGELLHNASEITTWKEELPTMGVPFPGFELEGWRLVSQADAFLALDHLTAERLVHVYNRLRSCNRMLDELRDLNSGTSALAVEFRAAASVSADGTVPRAMEIAIDEFKTHKRDVRDGLLRRVDDLDVHINNAIDAVEREIRIAAPVPAAQRLFRHTTPPDFVGGTRE